MFIYGVDIPLEGAASADREPARPAGKPAAPMDYPFEYGRAIFPEDDETQS